MLDQTSVGRRYGLLRSKHAMTSLEYDSPDETIPGLPYFVRTSFFDGAAFSK